MATFKNDFLFNNEETEQAKLSVRKLHLNEHFISGDVMESKNIGNCSNNGVTARYNQLYVVDEDVTLEEVENLCRENPHYKVEQFLKVDYKFYDSHDYIRLQPINNGKKWCMFGGQYLESSDSRFKNFVCGCKYPIPIHDRYESYQETMQYSS